MKKKYKRVISSIVILALCISTNLSVYAENTTNEKVIVKNNYTITESIDCSNQIVRTYEKSLSNSTFAINNRDSKVLNLDETKELLIMLGMEQQSVEVLSMEELHEYATAESIQSVTFYCKHDIEGNISYVTQEEAIRSAEEINANQINEIVNFVDGDENTRALSGTVTSQYRFFDEYMKMYYQVSDLADGNGSYKFVTEATWLTMPSQRMKDAVGSCAQGVTITPNTQSGYYTYKKSQIVDGNVLDETSVRSTFTSSSFANVTDGVYLGVAAYFNLPNNVYTSTYTTMNYDFFVHAEYKGKVQHPQLATNFNTSATYTHVKTTLSFSPSLSISYEEGAIGVIDITTTRTEQKRNIFFEINYVPPS